MEKIGKLVKNSYPGMLGLFMSIISEHGEAQVVMDNGDTYSLHLGDQASATGSFLTFEDKEGNNHTLNFDKVSSIYTHRGYKEN